MNKLNTLVVAFALTTAASGAHAQDGSMASFADSLIDQGYSEISEGLYARVSGNETLYVAQGSSGNRALTAKLMEARDAHNAKVTKETGKPSAAVAKYNELIAQLNAPESKNQDNYGDCYGNPNSQMFHATAQAWKGVAANAYAANSNGSINTTNHASAWTINRPGTMTSYQAVTTYGTTPAQATASASTFRACDAQAWATITCPGFANPSVTAYAHHVAFTGCQS